MSFLKYHDLFANQLRELNLRYNPHLTSNGECFLRKSNDWYEGICICTSGGVKSTKLSYYADAVVSVLNCSRLLKDACDFRIIRGAENIEGTQRATLRSEKQALDWVTKICANFDGELQTLKEESLQPILCRTSAARAAAQRYSQLDAPNAFDQTQASRIARTLCTAEYFSDEYVLACAIILHNHEAVEPEVELDLLGKPLICLPLVFRVGFLVELLAERHGKLKPELLSSSDQAWW